MAGSAPVRILAPTIVRYTFQHTLRYGQKSDNVMDLSIDGTGLISRDSVITDFNSHVAGMWQDTALKIYGTTSTFNGAAWIDLDSLTGSTGTLGPADGHPVAGSGGGGFLPPNVAHLVHKRGTAHRGQRQGRSYFPDVPEATADDQGLLPSGYQTTIAGYMNSFRTTVGSYTYPADTANPVALRVVHVHKVNKDDPSTWTWTSTTVNTVDCDQRVATQRRRLR